MRVTRATPRAARATVAEAGEKEGEEVEEEEEEEEEEEVEEEVGEKVEEEDMGTLLDGDIRYI